MNVISLSSIAFKSLICSTILLFLTSFSSLGQVLIMDEGDLQSSTIVFESHEDLNDSLKVIAVSRQLQGYLQYQSDSLLVKGDSVYLFATPGPQYTLHTREYAPRARKGDFTILSDEAIRAVARRNLEPFENNGYPFATARLRPKLLGDTLISFEIETDPGRLVTWDSLAIDSKRPFNRTYLEQYLGIRPGRPYSEKTLRRIPSLINDLNFAKLTAPPQVIFRENKADLYIYLDDVRANQFDGIVGFQPDIETGRPVFTGDISLSLENALRRGEHIDFQWRRLQELTQNLKLSGSLPYLLHTRLGVWGGVELYRRDSTFTTSELDLAVGYLLGADRYLRTFIERWSSNALRPNVPNIDNISIRRYGLAWQSYRYDLRMNPMKGFSLTTEVAAGIKDLTEASDAEEPEISRHNQYSGSWRASAWIPLSSRFSVVLRTNGGFKADSTLRLSEYFRIGGLNTLRGFDEEAIFARNYAVGTVELKYLLDRTSAFFAFFDQGWYDRAFDGYFSDMPFGFGVGALVGTENSTFRIYYALGSEQNNPVLVRNGKVHFGFINRF